MATVRCVPRSQIGPLVREWRHRRHRSQLDLSLEVGVSAKHLSFVETGRSRPSPELVLALGEHLDVPLRERNRMLLAAGHAPRYSHTPLDDATMGRIRASLQRMLDAHDPYPGVVINRKWDVVLHNQAAAALISAVSPAVAGPPLNVFRACLHPDGLAPATINFDDWASYLLRQIRRTIELTADPDVVDLEAELLTYPNVAHLVPVRLVDDRSDPPLLVPFELVMAGQPMSMFTTLTTFGTPRDVTLEELAIELFFPADDQTEALLRSREATSV